MRGATSWTKLIVHFLAFQPTRPLRGATAFEYSIEPYYKISTHAPLAGRDQGRPKQLHGLHHFNPRAPCGARRGVRVTSAADQISTHAPLAGRDTIAPCAVLPRTISTHAPLAGRDKAVDADGKPTEWISTHAPLAGRDCSCSRRSYPTQQDFNPRAPCGARQQKCTNHYAHFCDNRQISDAFAQNAACQGILLLFDAGKPCGFWVRTAQVISAHLCFAL